MKLLLVGRLNFNPQVRRWIELLITSSVEVAFLHLGSAADQPEWVKRYPDLRIIYADAAASRGRLSRVLRPLALLRSSMRAIRAEAPEVVWILCLWSLALPIAMLAKSKRIPVALTVCGSDFNRGQRSVRTRAVFRLMLHCSAVVATTTVEMMEAVERRFVIPAAKRLVLYWGISLKHFSPAPELERLNVRSSLGIRPEDLVIYGGRFFRPIVYNLQAVQGVANAAAQISGRTVWLLLIDWGSDAGLVKETMEAVSCSAIASNTIVFPGPLGEAQLRRVYASSDVTLNLLSQDQLGATIFEAMSVGSYVIATDLPQYKRTADEGFSMSIVSRSHLTQDLEAALLSVAERQESERIRIRELNASLVEKRYSFEANAPQFIDALRGLVATSSRYGSKE